MWMLLFVSHSEMDSLHFYSQQCVSSDSSAQSALWSHSRWDSMQWPLRHTKSVTAGQLTGSTTSKKTQRHKWKEREVIRFLIIFRTDQLNRKLSPLPHSDESNLR